MHNWRQSQSDRGQRHRGSFRRSRACPQSNLRPPRPYQGQPPTNQEGGNSWSHSEGQAAGIGQPQYNRAQSNVGWTSSRGRSERHNASTWTLKPLRQELPDQDPQSGNSRQQPDFNSGSNQRHQNSCLSEKLQDPQTPQNTSDPLGACTDNYQCSEGGKTKEACQWYAIKEPKKQFCDYCGDDWSNGQVAYTNEEEVYHEQCLKIHIPRCEEALKEFMKFRLSNEQILKIAINVGYLYETKPKDKAFQKAKKGKRDNKIQELLKYASACRNSASGTILIHLVGLEEGDSFTGAFDDFVDEKLNLLINDGQLFTDVYKIDRLSSNKKLAKFHDFLVLFVDGSECLTTSDFRTKLALDDRIIDPTHTNVSSYLRRRKQFEGNFHTLSDVSTFEHLENIQESRSIQLKGNFKDEDNRKSTATYLFQDLKLAEYITAFTKLESGGSYIYGVREKPVHREHYISRGHSLQPVDGKDCEGLENSVKEEIVNKLLVCDYDGYELKDIELVQVNFIPTRLNVEKVVVHVSVRPVNGLVFYDKEGPLAYEYVQTKVERICAKRWFEYMNKFISNPKD